MGRCRQRVSSCRSAGETTAASHSGDSQSRLEGEVKRQSEWVELGYLKCVYELNGHGDEEQCFHSHRHLGSRSPCKREKI